MVRACTLPPRSLLLHAIVWFSHTAKDAAFAARLAHQVAGARWFVSVHYGSKTQMVPSTDQKFAQSHKTV